MKLHALLLLCCAAGASASSSSADDHSAAPATKINFMDSIHSTHHYCHLKAKHGGGGAHATATASTHRRRLSGASSGSAVTICPDTCEELAHPHSYISLIFVFFALFLGCTAM
jgi:hypothetical protein